MATIYNTATTLDGFLATTDNSLSWLFEVQGADDAESSFGDFLAGIGAMAMGSTTYEWLLEHEALVDNPARWQEWYAERPTWVFTHRELPVVAGADITFTSDDVRAVHAAMAAAAGERDIWLMGGGDLVGQFDDAGLLDRITATIAPAPLCSRATSGRTG
jgi:dihydrofolate reductase